MLDFIGSDEEVMRLMGHKDRAREAAIRANVQVVTAGEPMPTDICLYAHLLAKNRLAEVSVGLLRNTESRLLMRTAIYKYPRMEKNKRGR